MVLGEFLGHLWGKKRWGDGAIRDLEVSLRAQGPVHPAFDTMFERCGKGAYFARLLGCTSWVLGGAFLALWFPARAIRVLKIPGTPPPPVMVMLGCSWACMSVVAKMEYYDLQYGFAKIALKYGDESTKMELAKIILTNHSEDKSLVEAVRRHYVADHLFSDQHQEQRLLRWRQRGSYVDSALLEKLVYEALLEKMKHETNNCDDGAKSNGLFQEDPLAYLLTTPDAARINKSPEEDESSKAQAY